MMLSDIVVERYHLTAEDLVIDIGCNDGTLLSGFQRHGVQTLGVDPAQNLGRLCRCDRYRALYQHSLMLGRRRTLSQKWGQASVITATNTFPHIPDLPDFIEGINTALAPAACLSLKCITLWIC